MDATSIDPEKLRWCTHVIWNFPFTGVDDDFDSNSALLVAFFNGLTASILDWKLSSSKTKDAAPMVHMLLQVSGFVSLPKTVIS